MKPDIVLMGHRHTNGLTTVYDTKVYESGCVDGPDNYCMDKRLKNKPEQTVLVVNDLGLDCAYDVKLDNPAAFFKGREVSFWRRMLRSSLSFFVAIPAA